MGRQIARESLTTGLPADVLPMTDRLVKDIAKFNGYLSFDEVRRALLAGSTIYTTFSKYTLLSEDEKSEI